MGTRVQAIGLLGQPEIPPIGMGDTGRHQSSKTLFGFELLIKSKCEHVESHVKHGRFPSSIRSIIAQVRAEAVSAALKKDGIENEFVDAAAQKERTSSQWSEKYTSRRNYLHFRGVWGLQDASYGHVLDRIDFAKHENVKINYWA